jgi:alkylation response protein AidB-like acyl-CoA dehydrogenase
LLDRECDARRVRAIAYHGDGRDPALWRSLADAGWTGIAVPEEFGGAGLKFEDACIVFEEAGRAALPLPLTTTLLASRALSRTHESAPRNELLGRIASGEASVTLALREYQGSSAAEDGVFAFVPHGPIADVVLIDDDGRLIAAETRAPGLRWIDLDLIDRTVPHCQLHFALEAPSNAPLIDAAGVRQLIAEWTVALAAESLGACERTLEMSVAYAKERMQFGRPIGANQAVKNRLADMGAAIERMRAAVYHAAVKIDADAEDCDLAVAMAKVATAGQGAWLGSQAIHVHGGVGYTWEHDLHLYFKRIKSNELFLGDDSRHLARVADAVL